MTVEQIIDTLLTNRGLVTEADRREFFEPTPPMTIKLSEVGLDEDQVDAACDRLMRAVANKEPVVIYGDYDADGVCATAITWETLHSLSAKVHPFIPHRVKHGYGLSQVGADELIAQFQPSLVITVDNGIVAHDTVDYLQAQGVDVIVTDHHHAQGSAPAAVAVVHSETVCGSGVAWFLMRELSARVNQPTGLIESLLELTAIGTVTDLMTLLQVNRSLVKFGLEQLNGTKRPGIVALRQEAGVKRDQALTTYHLGFVIGPRLNAMGRLEHGLDALRLLCTKNPDRARDLAQVLGDTNRERQELTQDLVALAVKLYEADKATGDAGVIVIAHESFHEGVVGLIASKLVELYHKPSIVLSSSGELSKGSARSIKGINIIELIRQHEDLLLKAGGHKLAAGLSLETKNIAPFTTAIQQSATELNQDLYQVKSTADLSLPLSDLSLKLWRGLQLLEPFGAGNSEPVFEVEGSVDEPIVFGRDQTHLRFNLIDGDTVLPTVWFNGTKNRIKLEPSQTYHFQVRLNFDTYKNNMQLTVRSVPHSHQLASNKKGK